MRDTSAGLRLGAVKVLSVLSRPAVVLLLLTLLALALRVWRLRDVPPGWRDDELINTMVISQKVLDGEWAVYYADASGHEALYHVLAAGLLALFGPGAVAIRGVSAVMGALTVPLTYVLTSRLFNRTVALFASAGLALSFWSLMYSRTGIRHISAPLLALATFHAFWRGHSAAADSTGGEASDDRDWRRRPWIHFLAAGLFMGLGFYTYFASRGVPLVLLVFALYLLALRSPTLRSRWRGWLLMLVAAVFLALPLVVTLRQQPEAEARVSELAAPLVEAGQGDFDLLAEHVRRTLNMFHSDGDAEWLYNIPGRPLFGVAGVIFFWAGVAVALYFGVQPLVRSLFSLVRRRDSQLLGAYSNDLSGPAAFLLTWWLTGISPAFVSVPPASLGHTILAQPATYILAALPLLPVGRWLGQQLGREPAPGRLATAGLGLVLLASIAGRDLPDYFVRWPGRTMTRFLYRDEVRNLADHLNDHPEQTSFGVTGLLAGPWDRVALEIDVTREAPFFPRWYNPERAILLQLAGEPAANYLGDLPIPVLKREAYEVLPGEGAGYFLLGRVTLAPDKQGEPICFRNGLCWLAADYAAESGTLDLTWQVGDTLALPPLQLISNPPPPGIYAGPRLSVFGHLLGSDGSLLAGDDGLWVDPETLLPGDLFLQRHRLIAPAGTAPATVGFGLYDPMTGQRILTEDGRDQIRLDLEPD